MRHILLGILMAAAAWTARAQIFETLRLQRSYAGRADDFTNGYARAVRCEEWGYDNLWNDKTEAMITRASNGQMVMEWESDPVKRIDADGARFLFLISADLFPHFCNISYFNTILRIHMHQFHTRCDSLQYRDACTVCTDDDTFIGDHHNLIIFIDCLGTNDFTCLFCDLVALNSFTTTMLCCKLRSQCTFTHTICRYDQ